MISENNSEYNDLKLFTHTDHIRGFLNNKRVSPIYIRIKPTNICNQSCYYCCYAKGTRIDDRQVDRIDSIPWEVMQDFLMDINDMGVKAVTFSGGGDPLCYSYIKETLDMILQYDIDFSVITNGYALCDEIAKRLYRAKWIRVSLDSADENTYNRIRRVNAFNAVIENISNFSKKKDTKCVLGINCVVSKNNSNQIYEICKLCKELGCDNVKLAPIRVAVDEESYHDEIKELVLEQIQKAVDELETDSFHIIDKYSGELDILGDFRKTYHRCYIQEFFTVLAADCKVYRCHQRAYTKSGEIGDLRKARFRDIWYSEETIKRIREYDPVKECKMGCVFENRNRLLFDLVNIDPNHVNFI